MALSNQLMDERTRDHRAAEVALTLLAPDGRPLAGAEAVAPRRLDARCLQDTLIGNGVVLERPPSA